VLCVCKRVVVALSQLIGYLLVGRLVVFVLQKFPFQKTFIGRLFKEGEFLADLLSCSLCLGCYVYATLAYIFQIDFINNLFNVYVVVLNEIMTGIIASFVVYIFEIGWNTRFGIIEVN